MRRSRLLLRDLRALGEARAPATLLPSVLERVGLGAADRYTGLESAIGPVYVVWNQEGVSAVSRADGAAGFERAFRSRFGRAVRRAERLPEGLVRAIRGLLDGSETAAGSRTLRFDLRSLSEFERAVLLKALQIPRGEVRPYGWVAREIGRPAAVRAVGSALGRNPIPLLIPCHRVVRSDCRIGDYAFGSEAKRAILEAEGVDTRGVEELARRGARYLGSDTTHIYCFPTCRNARRITPAHRLSFASPAAAAQAGYRPCRVCRPA